MDEFWWMAARKRAYFEAFAKTMAKWKDRNQGEDVTAAEGDEFIEDIAKAKREKMQ